MMIIEHSVHRFFASFIQTLLDFLGLVDDAFRAVHQRDLYDLYIWLYFLRQGCTLVCNH